MMGITSKDFALIPIDGIKIGCRFRKDLGDIDSLAKDISEIDLLQPVVVNDNHELICGVRRIEAFKALGRSEIPARIVNLDDIVRGEISENTQRKDFSWEEIIEIKKAVEPEIKKESEKRMLSGKPSAKFAEGSSNNNDNNNITSKNYSESQTRTKVAAYVSLHGKKISHPTLAIAEKVYDVAQKEPTTFGQIWEDLNSEKISPHKAFKKVQKIQTRQKFLAEKPAIPLPDGIKLIEGNFIEKTLDIADKSVDLILTDPPYDLKSLTLYQELAKVASRVLKDGGSLVTYCGQDYKYQIQQFMESSGLTPRWELAVILSGPYARIFKKQVLVTWKPLLWFVKGSEKRTPDFIEDSVVSPIPPAKKLHDWEQSTTEAYHVISKLTFPNDVVLDCFMGIGTTGIAALDLKRQFIGIEKDAEVFQIARRRISSMISSDQKSDHKST
jgi:16S rRNA G966 N2-methylase RsmD